MMTIVVKIVSNILKKAQGQKFEKEWIQFIDFIVIIPSGIIILNYLHKKVVEKFVKTLFFVKNTHLLNGHLL